MHEDHYTRLRGGESCSECRTRNAEPHTVAIEAELRRDRVAATDQMISEQTAERAEREVGTRMCGRSRLRRLFLDQFECGARDAETQGADFLDAGIDRIGDAVVQHAHRRRSGADRGRGIQNLARSEEHTSELQSLM